MTNSTSQFELQRPRRRFRARLQGWMFALLGAFLIAVPTVRTNELSEIGTASERVEDASFVSSIVSLKRTTNHGRREAIVFTSSIQSRLGREQHSKPLPGSGHRLPNGLMAPMTC
jgi:hypothetical protein